MDKYIEGSTIIKANTLEELDAQVNLSEDNLLQMKEIMGEKLEYELDFDYEQLTITINIKVENSEDGDSSERNPQLN